MNKHTHFLFLTIAIFTVLYGCKKDKLEQLHMYQLSDISNAAVQNARCGIDLANGRLYGVVEGRDHQNDIDIAYGYMSSEGVETRCFLSLSYAGCFCGGSSYFSYGDQTGGGGRQGYASYSILNNTKLAAGQPNIDFDGVAEAGTKAALDAVFNEHTQNYTNEVLLADKQDNLVTRFVLFKTVKGKRGIIRVKPYTKNTSANYNLQENRISIEVIVEK